MAACIVHELTHQERDDGLVSQVQTEIASHVAQFVFEPNSNQVFNRQLQRSLANIEKDRQSKQDSLSDLYDKAQHFALIIIGHYLLQQDEAQRTRFMEDTDPDKLPSLRGLIGKISEENQEYLREKVLPVVMTMSNSQLLFLAEKYRQPMV